MIPKVAPPTPFVMPKGGGAIAKAAFSASAT